jgi:hypothetical protein
MRSHPTDGRFAASTSKLCMSLMGRQLPTADVGYPVAQLGGPLSGGEIARPTGACRPTAAVQCFDPASWEPPLAPRAPDDESRIDRYTGQ